MGRVCKICDKGAFVKLIRLCDKALLVNPYGSALQNNSKLCLLICYFATVSTNLFHTSILQFCSAFL